jgi:phosphoribosylanthranilate isomerase
MDRTFVKICGVRTPEAVDTAVEHGADAVGFVFGPSPRQVDAGTARALADRVPEDVLTVGVFRDLPLGTVTELADAVGVRAVQLHGSEDRSYYERLRRPGRLLIRGASFAAEPPVHGELGEDILLLDAPVPGAGVPWDWSRLPASDGGRRWLLAGGLTPANVADAIAVTRPWGVDVSSGVESSRSAKAPALIAEFLAAARAA